MIMAAGAGTRLDPLTQKIPKPMVPIANIPIMELILNHLKKFGINEVIANTHSLADQIHDKFGKENHLGINFEYVYEKELSGTAGGVKKCEWFFEQGETFVVISGDALTDINLDALIKKHKDTGAIATMALREVPVNEVSQFGVVVVDNKSRVIGFQEKPAIEQAKSNLVNTGIYVFETDIFKYIPENTFYDFAKNVFPDIMANNDPLCAHVINDYWNDIGTINQYRLSSFDALKGKVTINMPYKESELGWCADNCVISKNAVFNDKLIIGDNTVIEDKVRFYGNSIIGNYCIIKEGAEIRNSILWDNIVIEEGVKLDGCVVASNSRIGRDSILAPGNIIPDGTNVPAQERLIESARL